MHDLHDLVGVTDIAMIAGVSKAAVSNWSLRHDDFPEPLAVVSKSIPLYSRREITEWLALTGRTS